MQFVEGRKSFIKVAEIYMKSICVGLETCCTGGWADKVQSIAQKRNENRINFIIYCKKDVSLSYFESVWFGLREMQHVRDLHTLDVVASIKVFWKNWLN